MARPSPFLPLPGIGDPSTTAPTQTTTSATTNNQTPTTSPTSSPTAGSSPASSSSPSSSGTGSPSSGTTQGATSPTKDPSPTIPDDPTPPGGGIVTKTSLYTVTTANTPPTNTVASGESSFFQNKAAVAGIFSVVGLAGVVLLIALITTAVRRRQAKKFDKETEDAAAAAAATAHAPAFLDDDPADEYPHPGGSLGFQRRPSGTYNQGGGNGYDPASGYPGSMQYSDVSSHGTYAQPPMTTSSHSHHGHDMYGMRELGNGHSVIPRPGELYNPFDAAPPPAGQGGNAGVGVARSRSVPDPAAFASGLSEGGAPYAAFAHPGYFQQQSPAVPFQSQPPYPYAGHATPSPTQGNGHNMTGSLRNSATFPQQQPGMSLNHDEYASPPPNYPQRSGSLPSSAFDVKPGSRPPSALIPGAVLVPQQQEHEMDPGEVSPPEPVSLAPSTDSDKYQQPESAHGSQDEGEDVEPEERPRVLKIANE